MVVQAQEVGEFGFLRNMSPIMLHDFSNAYI